MTTLSIAILAGKTLNTVEGLTQHSERVDFHCSDGTVYRLFHREDCCESVLVEDVCGDPDDLLGSPIVQAEESTSNDPIEGQQRSESFTWSFYRLATAKGQVVIRWLGESNGYYSESVDFIQL